MDFAFFLKYRYIIFCLKRKGRNGGSVLWCWYGIAYGAYGAFGN